MAFVAFMHIKTVFKYLTHCADDELKLVYFIFVMLYLLVYCTYLLQWF